MRTLQRAVAQRQERRHWAVEDESVTEGFSGQQEFEQKAQATAVRRAGVQAVEACTTSTVAALQTGTACEDRDAEAEVRALIQLLPQFSCAPNLDTPAPSLWRFQIRIAFHH